MVRNGRKFTSESFSKSLKMSSDVFRLRTMVMRSARQTRKKESESFLGFVNLFEDSLFRASSKYFITTNGNGPSKLPSKTCKSESFLPKNKKRGAGKDISKRGWLQFFLKIVGGKEEFYTFLWG